MCVAEEMQKMKLESREKDLKEKARYSTYLPAWIVWIPINSIARRLSLMQFKRLFRPFSFYHHSLQFLLYCSCFILFSSSGSICWLNQLWSWQRNSSTSTITTMVLRTSTVCPACSEWRRYCIAGTDSDFCDDLRRCRRY